MIRPAAFELRYHREPVPGEQATASAAVLARDVSSVAQDVFADEALEASYTFDGETLSLAVTPHASVALDSCIVTFAHDYPAGEKVLLNGYQTWTDTYERDANARMRGLHGVPRALVRRFVLDGSGDYRFTDYPNRPGCQHGFTYAHFRCGDAYALLASLCEDDGFTLVRTDVSARKVTAAKECPAHAIEPGQTYPLFRIACIEGSCDEVYGRWFALAQVAARPARPLVGYTSWYRHYHDIDAAGLEADLSGVADFLDAADTAEFERVFQIDDGFCRIGDWLEPDAKRFPQGLAPLARRVAVRGLVPGLWIAPFVCERDSHLFAAHPDWLLCDAAGEPVPTGCHWSGGFALDTRHPDVRAYIQHVIQTMTREWGFRLLKADFLYAACMQPHDGMNRGELMADAIELLRAAAGEEVALLCCGVPLASAFGRTEYCRIGCDVGLDWDDKPWMRLLHRERVSTRNSLADTLGRAPLGGRAFANDPDVFFLRDDVKITREQRMMLLESDASSAQVLLTSDDMAAWGADERAAYEAALKALRGRL